MRAIQYTYIYIYIYIYPLGDYFADSLLRISQKVNCIVLWGRPLVPAYHGIETGFSNKVPRISGFRA